MTYHCGKHDYGIALWLGDVEHDYGQFGIVKGEWGIFYSEGSQQVFLDLNDEENLDYLIFETPGGNSDSDGWVKSSSSLHEALSSFLDYLSDYNKDNYDIIKAIFI